MVGSKRVVVVVPSFVRMVLRDSDYTILLDQGWRRWEGPIFTIGDVQ